MAYHRPQACRFLVLHAYSVQQLCVSAAYSVQHVVNTEYISFGVS